MRPNGRRVAQRTLERATVTTDSIHTIGRLPPDTLPNHPSRRCTVRDEPTWSERVKRTRIACAAIVVAAAALSVLASPATAAVSVSSYSITANMPASPTPPNPGPSTVAAGAHPDAGSFSTFGYPNTTEDLKTAITHFGPGLLGNPESVPKCPEATLQLGNAATTAAMCASSIIGTSRLDVPGFASFQGTLYNAELIGDEPGRLAAVTNAGPLGTLVSSI